MYIASFHVSGTPTHVLTSDPSDEEPGGSGSRTNMEVANFDSKAAYMFVGRRVGPFGVWECKTIRSTNTSIYSYAYVYFALTLHRGINHQLRICLCAFSHLYTHMYVYMYVDIYFHIYIQGRYISLCLNLYMYVYIHIYKQIHIYIYVYTYISIYIYMSIYIHIDIYTKISSRIGFPSWRPAPSAGRWRSWSRAGLVAACWRVPPNEDPAEPLRLMIGVDLVL